MCTVHDPLGMSLGSQVRLVSSCGIIFGKWSVDPNPILEQVASPEPGITEPAQTGCPHRFGRSLSLVRSTAYMSGGRAPVLIEERF